MKYIVYQDIEYGAIVFPEGVNHLSVTRNLTNMNGVRMTIISAGLVYRKDGVLWVEGVSKSLNLGSRREDVPIIERSILQ